MPLLETYHRLQPASAQAALFLGQAYVRATGRPPEGVRAVADRRPAPSRAGRMQASLTVQQFPRDPFDPAAVKWPCPDQRESPASGGPLYCCAFVFTPFYPKTPKRPPPQPLFRMPSLALHRAKFSTVLPSDPADRAGYTGERAVGGRGRLDPSPLAPRSGPAGITMFTLLPPAQTGIQCENNYDDPQMWAAPLHPVGERRAGHRGGGGRFR